MIDNGDRECYNLLEYYGKEKNMDGKYEVLDKVNGPKDLKGLSDDELDLLSDEIRDFLVEKVNKNGGHLASNLGVVELTVAIHRVFDLPKDHLIFDVGHQSYVHKILTGRKDGFDSLRKGGGLSGFTKREESEYDCFGAGHSSTSLSAAIGFAEADRLNGSDAYTVAVVGDGAYTGGMIHEALNNINRKQKLIVIINENEMSISKNIGRFANNMAKLRAGRNYLRTKHATIRFITHIPLIGKWLFRRIRDVKKFFKNMIYGSNYFEDLGLWYLGPIDGNDRDAVERLLKEAKRSGQSAIVKPAEKSAEAKEPAEKKPDQYHGVMPADSTDDAGSFSKVMSEELCALAEKDKKICAITAAMAEGTGLTAFADRFKDRFFDVGIAEEHALTFAAGLAAEGMKPVVAVYSTFLQRAYDNVIHDIALQKLPVVIGIDRAGINASDGPTHNGIFDVAFLSEIPGMKIYTPTTEEGLKNSLREAIASGEPSAIRYPRCIKNETIKEKFYADGDYSLKIARRDFETADAVVITHGRIANEALAAENTAKREGIALGTILLEKLKPYDATADAVSALIPENCEKIVFLEEEIRSGGMGMLLCDAMTRKGMLNGKKVAIMALDDNFAERKRDISVYREFGLSAENIVKTVKSL